MRTYNILKINYGLVKYGDSDKPYRQVGQVEAEGYQEALQTYYEQQAEDDPQAYRKFVDEQFIVQDDETEDDEHFAVQAVNGMELMFKNA